MGNTETTRGFLAWIAAVVKGAAGQHTLFLRRAGKAVGGPPLRSVGVRGRGAADRGPAERSSDGDGLGLDAGSWQWRRAVLAASVLLVFSRLDRWAAKAIRSSYSNSLQSGRPQGESGGGTEAAGASARNPPAGGSMTGRTGLRRFFSVPEPGARNRSPSGRGPVASTGARARGQGAGPRWRRPASSSLLLSGRAPRGPNPNGNQLAESGGGGFKRPDGPGLCVGRRAMLTLLVKAAEAVVVRGRSVRERLPACRAGC